MGGEEAGLSLGKNGLGKLFDMGNGQNVEVWNHVI
jgi:hypothetical protein